MTTNTKSIVSKIIILAVLVLVLVGIYSVIDKPKQIKEDIFDVNPVSTQVTIMVPSDMVAYEKAMNDYIYNGKTNPAKTWPFVPKIVPIATTSDTIPASIQAAAEQIPTQGGVNVARVAYLKRVGSITYVLLGMHLDGWAGVSVSLAKIEPLVEKTLLQFSGITSVKFSPAPGDTGDEILKEYIKSTAIISQPSITILSPQKGERVKAGSTLSIKWTTINTDNRVLISVKLSSIEQVIYPEFGTDLTVENSGSFLWKVPKSFDELNSTPVDRDYPAYITIRDSKNKEIFGRSEEFTITK